MTEWYVTVAATIGSKLSFAEQQFRLLYAFRFLIKIIFRKHVSSVVFFIFEFPFCFFYLFKVTTRETIDSFSHSLFRFYRLCR